MENLKDKTGVKIYVMTVDEETGEVLKREEEDPNTGERTDSLFELAVEDQQESKINQNYGGALPPNFVPSVVILVGGQSVVSSSPQLQPSSPHPKRFGPIRVYLPPRQPPRTIAATGKGVEGETVDPPKV